MIISPLCHCLVQKSRGTRGQRMGSLLFLIALPRCAALFLVFLSSESTHKKEKEGSVVGKASCKQETTFLFSRATNFTVGGRQHIVDVGGGFFTPFIPPRSALSFFFSATWWHLFGRGKGEEEENVYDSIPLWGPLSGNFSWQVLFLVSRCLKVVS